MSADIATSAARVLPHTEGSALQRLLRGALTPGGAVFLLVAVLFVAVVWINRRPEVTRVSAPSLSAAPTRNSRLRSLLPPNASGSRSSRFAQTSTVPPSASENRGSRCSGDGSSNSGNRGSAEIPGGASCASIAAS
jgi:hypothetical protein